LNSTAGKDKTNKRGNASRDAILDAAEALFGRFGPEGVSLRQIASAAGSANHSAVHYHFKNKEGLLDGIFDRRLTSLEKRRSMLLDSILQQGREGDPRALLEGLLLPIAEEKDSSGQCSFAAFLLGMRMFGDITRWHRYSASAPVTSRFNQLLRACIDTAEDEVFSIRQLSAVSVFLISVVDWDRRDVLEAHDSAMTRDEYLQHILDYAAAGMLSAPRSGH